MTMYSLPEVAWMTGPCPAWCTTAHHTLDHPSARVCESKAAVTSLDLHEGYEHNGKQHLEDVHVSIEAPYGASLPHIAVFAGDGTGQTFTLAEAEQHARQILALVAEARSANAQGVTP